MADNPTGVYGSETIKFIETACRNWHRVSMDRDGIDDMTEALARHAREAADAREAEVVAGMVAMLTSAHDDRLFKASQHSSGGRDYNMGWATGLANAADRVRRGDWKGQSK